MLVGNSADLTRVDPFRCVHLPDVLLHNGRCSEDRRALRALSTLLGMPEDVTIQGCLTAKLFRTVRALVRHLSGMHPKVHFQGSFMQKPTIANLAFKFFDPIVNLFMLLQGGAEFENFPAEFT